MKRIILVLILAGSVTGCAGAHYRPTFTVQCGNQEAVRVYRWPWNWAIVPYSDETIASIVCMDGTPHVGW